MKHVKIEIIANEHQQEELIAFLDDCHATGFEQTDETLVAYFDATGFSKTAVMEILEGYSVRLQEVEEKNWNEEWERNFQPVIVDDFVVIRAHFHPPVTNAQHEIVITPKMSFGTGHHATTYLMMQQMRNLDLKNKSVFDFGTGTGILAILAEKLGAERIVAIDTDDWSIANATENFERNQCRKIAVSLTSHLPNERFDVILANINRNVLLEYMRQLSTILQTGGSLLLSGLLVADVDGIVDAAEKQGLRVVRQIERNGWISILLLKEA